jgi:hypothetical protein
LSSTDSESDAESEGVTSVTKVTSDSNNRPKFLLPEAADIRQSEDASSFDLRRKEIKLERPTKTLAGGVKHGKSTVYTDNVPKLLMVHQLWLWKANEF